MRPNGTPQELERRRLRAVSLLEAGQTPTHVAQMVGADRRSVHRWQRAYGRSGEEGLKAKPAAGRPPRLREAQKRRLVKQLLRGPKEHGFSTDLWTCGRIAQVIRKRFGVKYHPDHVWRILQGLGWSCQRPERRAYERNEKAVQRWLSRDWPRIKKSP